MNDPGYILLPLKCIESGKEESVTAETYIHADDFLLATESIYFGQISTTVYTKSGYNFKFENLEEALRDLL